MKIQNLEEEIATLRHKRINCEKKKKKTAEMTLTGVLGVIFEVDEEEKKEYYLTVETKDIWRDIIYTMLKTMLVKEIYE